MASQIGWIDYSPIHKERIHKFMDMMGVGGVVDELGVGIIRDKMSRELFPGFSTLYTRAKYFFITPYILRDLTKEQSCNNPGKFFREREKKANNIISKYYKEHTELSGESYFGKNTKDGELKRQPSAIYWNGMRSLNLITVDSSLAQILSEKQSNKDELLSSNNKEDDASTKEQGEYNGRKYDNVSETYDSDWLKKIEAQGVSLTLEEATTLKERLQSLQKDSLPAALVTDEELWRIYRDAQESYKSSKYGIKKPFVHFVDMAHGQITNKILRNNLIAAHDLSLFLYGIHIAYNIQFWSKIESKEAKNFVQEMQDKGRSWFNELKEHMIAPETFKIDDKVYMEDNNVKASTRTFLKDFHKEVFQSDAKSWDDMEASLRKLAEMQERCNKGTKSRFLKLDKEQVMDEVNPNAPQWLGLEEIEYRYGATLSIVKDIYEGLKQTKR